MSEELKPCPFCGGQAKRVDIEEGENAGGSCIVCTRCLASGNVEFGRKENFVANWNSRAALKDRDVVLEEAAERAAFVAGYRAAHMVPDAYDSTSAAEEAWEGYRLVSRALKERV